MSEEKSYVLVKAVLSFCVLFLIDGCGGGGNPALTEAELEGIPFAQREGLPEASVGFVLAVGGETITAEEIVIPLTEHFRPVAQRSDYAQFKQRVGPELERIIVARVSNILLYSQAKRDIGGEQIEERLEEVAEAEVRRFIVGFEGDYAKAEEALKQMGFDWASFKEYKKKEILSQSYIASQLPENKPITYSELIDRYNEMREEFFVTAARLKFRLIDIQPSKLEVGSQSRKNAFGVRVADPNKSRQEQVRELANELLGRLQAGEDFGALAKQYSHGHRAMFGGLWKPVQPDSLAEPYDILASVAEKIKPGQIAGPIEAGEHIFIMKLEEKRAKGVEPFEKVQKQVEQRIIIDRRKQAVDELGARLVQQAVLKNMDAFVGFCLGEIYRMSNE